MGNCIKKRVAVLLTAAMLATVLPFGIFGRKEQADTKTIELNLTQVEWKHGTVNIYTPNVDGTLKSLIYVNGDGGPKMNEYVPYIKQWMNDGYIKPMVVFMPFFYNGKPDLTVFARDMNLLVNEIKGGTYDSQIGKTIDKSELTLCGYSMGGAISGLAGSLYKSDLINIGALSPSPQLHHPSYYKEGYSPFLEEQKDCDGKFTTDPNKHLFLVCGSAEGDITSGVEYGYNKYGKNQGFARMKFIGNEESHTHKLFRKELFCFMYYIQNNELPSDELIYKVFGKGYTIEKTMPVKPDQPTPTNTNTPTPTSKPKPTDTNTPTPTPKQNKPALSGSVNVSGYYRCYQPLDAKAVNCPASNLKYQWKRNGVNISGAVYSRYTLTKEDIDTNVVCVITDKDGKYTGSISSTETKVKKGFGPDVPDVTGVDCSYEGASDGKILNVNTTMEYAKGSQNNPYTSCTGTSVTGLSKGTYYVRVKETETVAAGGIATVKIGEKKPKPTNTNTPTPTPTSKPKPTNTNTPTPTPTSKPKPTNTNTPTPTPTSKPKPTNTNTPTPTVTIKPTVTPLPNPTGPASQDGEATPTSKPTVTPVVTTKATASATPSATKVTATPAVTAAATPKAGVTASPSATVSVTPVAADSQTPAVTTAPEDTVTSVPSSSDVLKSGGNSYLPDVKNGVIFRSANPLITDLNIPSTVKIGGKKYKVTAIAAGAFKGNQKIRSAVIGKNIKSIGAGAFKDCKKLKKIIFKTVKLNKNTVAGDAFKGIAKKATFTLPKKKYKSYKKFLPKTAKGTKVTFKKNK